MSDPLYNFEVARKNKEKKERLWCRDMEAYEKKKEQEKKRHFKYGIFGRTGKGE